MAGDGGGISLRAMYSDDDWEGAYAMFSVILLLAAASTTFAIVQYTSEQGSRPATRLAAMALAILGTVSTVVAWAFPLWAVLLAAGYVALAATGAPHRRRAGWLGGALLAGLAVAIVALSAELGPAGEHNDYSEGQSWGITVACVLTATVLAVLARTGDARATVRSTPA